MAIEDGARKLRQGSEREHAKGGESKPYPEDERRREADKDAAEAHGELTQPDHSKGRPPPEDGTRRPSNAGNDGP